MNNVIIGKLKKDQTALAVVQGPKINAEEILKSFGATLVAEMTSMCSFVTIVQRATNSRKVSHLSGIIGSFAPFTSLFL